jgi:hypothetical protein
MGHYYLSKGDGYLMRRIFKSCERFSSGQHTYTMPTVTMIAGDVDGMSNSVQVITRFTLDCGYGLMHLQWVTQHQHIALAPACQAHTTAGVNIANVDLNGDGVIDANDETYYLPENYLFNLNLIKKNIISMTNTSIHKILEQQQTHTHFWQE